MTVQLTRPSVRYAEGAAFHLEEFIKNYGDAGKEEINSIGYAHQIEIDLAEPGQFTRDYVGTAVKDGKLVILFEAGEFGSNNNWGLREITLLPALNAAPPGPGSEPQMTFLARMGIATQLHEILNEAQKKIAGHLQNPDIKVDPNLEENFGKLLAESKTAGSSLDRDWQESFGLYTANYFKSFAYQLEAQNFSGEEMLREAFAEGVDKGLIALRIVDKLKKMQYCEVEIEDGVLYLQVRTPKLLSTLMESKLILFADHCQDMGSESQQHWLQCD